MSPILKHCSINRLVMLLCIAGGWHIGVAKRGEGRSCNACMNSVLITTQASAALCRNAGVNIVEY